jgi:hypothetical protein
MTNTAFNVPERPKDMIPKPFVIKDALVTKMDFNLSEFNAVPQDSTSQE